MKHVTISKLQRGCRRARAAIGAALVTWATLMPFVATADWPMPRGNARRTAVAHGKSNLVSPVPYWRHFLGGAITAEGAISLDVDGDGESEIVLVVQGAVQANEVGDNIPIWSVPSLNSQWIIGATDLDGDGDDDLLVRSTSQVFVLDPTDGAILWEEPVGQMGTIGGVRVADLTGDGLDDVFIQECACCSINSGNTGVVYSFAGDVSNPDLRWTLPDVSCGGGRSMTVAKIVGGSNSHVILGSGSQLRVLDGSNGTEIANTGNIGQSVQASRCQPVQIGSVEDLLCVMKEPVGPENNGRRLMLYHRLGTTLSIQWERLVGDVDGAVVIPNGMVTDLDGDGSREVVIGGRLNDFFDVLYVYDLVNGELLADLTGLVPVGTAPILSDGKSVILARNPDENLLAFSFDRNAEPKVALEWTLVGRGAAGYIDLDDGRRSFLKGRILTLDYDGDGVDDLLSTERDGLDLRIVKATGGSPEVLATYTMPSDTSQLAFYPFDGIGGSPDTRLGLASTSGALHVLDGTFQPMSENGVRFGGYLARGTFRQLRSDPVVASLGGASEALLVKDSRGTLHRLDAKGASFAEPPSTVWSRTSTHGASIVPGLVNGEAGILAIDNDESDERIVLLDGDANLVWDAPLLGATLTDLVSANFDGDGVPDVFVQYGDATDKLELGVALRGSDGSTLWNTTPFGPYNRQPAGVSIADWDGDGTDDIVMQQNGTKVLDGSNGSEVLSGGPGFAYFMPHLHDIDDDEDLEVVLHAGVGVPETLDHDLTTLFSANEDDRPMTYATIVDCPGAARSIGGSWINPARLKSTALGGPFIGTYNAVTLVGGESYPDGAPIPPDAYVGQLGSPQIHDNLQGDGAPIVVVGSYDGWLYALDACTLALRFSVDFGAPVGTVLFGDTDGDGLDEILTSVADGYLYALRESPVEPPSLVLDTDPPNGIVEDVDTITTHDTLYGSWLPVAGVDSYEVAVVRDNEGGFVSEPPWIDVGDVTSASLTGLELEDGKRYFFAVRATLDGSPSPDTLSDGVVVTLIEPDGSGGAGGGTIAPGGEVLLTGRACLCSAPRAATERTLPFLLLASSVFAARLRRRRRLR